MSPLRDHTDRPTGAAALVAVLGPLAALLVSPAAAPTTPVLRPAATASERYAVPSNGVFTVQGHGWGHGHGMSQVGAVGAARQGLNGEQILSFYYPGTSLTTKASPAVKVYLTADVDNDVQVVETGDLTATDRTPGDGAATQRLMPPAGVTASRWGVLRNAAGQHVLYLEKGNEAAGWKDTPSGLAGRHGVAGPIALTSASGSVRVYQGTSGTTYAYPGAAIGTTVSSGLQTTVEVPREQYLRGVIVTEIGGAPLQAARAQAVAARTYAAWRQEHPRSATVDVRDDTGDQVYRGAAYSAAGDQAVTSTADLVLLYGGAAAFTQFSASNGGWSVDGGPTYMPAQRDDYDGVSGSSSHSWSAVLPAAKVQAAFPTVGTLTSIEITRRDGNGEWGGRVLGVVLHGRDAVGRATAVTTTGSGLYDAYKWTGSGGPYADGLRHYWFTFVGVPPSSPEAVSATAGDGLATVSWQTPESPGTSAVSSYTILASPGGRGAVVGAGTTSATITGLDDGTRYTFTVTATSDAGSSAGAVSNPVTPVFTYADFVPTSPVRVFDSRSGSSPAGPTGALRAGETRTLTLAGTGVVPADATSVAVTVTSTQGTANSYFTVFPYAFPRPTASVVNWTPLADRAATVVAALGPGGRLNVYNDRGTADLVVDVVGYWTTSAAIGASRLRAVTPVRALDTRTSRPLGVGATRAAGLQPPSGATAVLANMTAVAPTSRTYLAGYPAGSAWPGTSTVNADAGDIRAVATMLRLGGGDVTVRNNLGSTDVLVDALGWFTPAGSGASGRVAAISPSRLLDTRSNGGPVPAGGSRTVKVLGAPGVPSSGISAVLVSLTAVGADGTTYVRADDGSAGQQHSSLNVTGPQATANLALVPLAADGTIRLYVDSARADLVLDVVGVVAS